MLNLEYMGVINMTPNSFSDGNRFNSYQNFLQRFKFLSQEVSCIDIGAESPAPFNSAIDFKEELKRYEEIFFPLLAELDDPNITLSLDTYKIDIFYEVGRKVLRAWPKTKLVFNDISGKIDKDLVRFFKSAPFDFSYIFSHNLAPTRADTVRHMETVFEGSHEEFLQHLVEYFNLGLKKLFPLKENIWIDPCFGFSKTRSQNHFLLKNFSSFLSQVESQVPVVYGVSKKSFLRFPAGKIRDERSHIELEQMHSILLFELFQQQQNKNIIVRGHDPLVLKSAKNIAQIFDLL